jgi:ribonucleotide reductase alpha subunit
VQALDNVIDTFQIPDARVQETATRNRRIGLGVMGVGKMLSRLLLPYDSEPARKHCSEVMRRINERALERSRELGSLKGWFPNLTLSVHADDARPPRNVARTMCAPTGTGSNAFGTTGGIEPDYALAYYRKFRGKQLQYINEDLLRMLEARGLIPSDRESQERHPLVLALNATGSLRRLAREQPALVKDVPELFVAAFPCAMDISAGTYLFALWRIIGLNGGFLFFCRGSH